MKKIFLITLLFWLTCSIGYSQDHENRKEKIKAMKTAFITTELNLTADEAAKFWPVYNHYDGQRFELFRKSRKSMMALEKVKLEELDEKAAEKILNDIEKMELETFELRRKMILELKPIIGAKKIVQLRKAEEDFNKKLLRQYRDRHPKK